MVARRTGRGGGARVDEELEGEDMNDVSELVDVAAEGLGRGGGRGGRGDLGGGIVEGPSSSSLDVKLESLEWVLAWWVEFLAGREGGDVNSAGSSSSEKGLTVGRRLAAVLEVSDKSSGLSVYGGRRSEVFAGRGGIAGFVNELVLAEAGSGRVPGYIVPMLGRELCVLGSPDVEELLDRR